MVLFINLIIVLVALGIQLSWVLFFKKIIKDAPFKRLVFLIILDALLTTSMLSLVYFKADVIYVQIIQALIYLIIGIFYVNYIYMLNKKNTYPSIVSFLIVLAVSLYLVFFGQNIDILVFYLLQACVVVFWILNLTTKYKTRSLRVRIYIYLLFASEILRYIVSGFITHEILFTTNNFVWIITIAFLIKTVTVLFVVEVYNYTRINRYLTKTLDFQTAPSILNLVFSENPNAVVLTDQNKKIIYANPKSLENAGYREDEVIGKTPKVFASGLTPRAVYEDMYRTLKNNNNWQGEFINKRKNGDIFYEQAKIVGLKDIKGETIFYLSIKTDITKEREYLNILKNYSRIDDLTGLLRRNYFLELIETNMEDDNENINKYLLLFDINEFKKINDTYGHLIGDQALKYFANKLQEAFNLNSYLCRIGGDEFAAFVYDNNKNTVDRMIEDLFKSLDEKPFIYEDVTIKITTSVGSTQVEAPFFFNKVYEKTDKFLYKSKKTKDSSVIKDY